MSSAFALNTRSSSQSTHNPAKFMHPGCLFFLLLTFFIQFASAAPASGRSTPPPGIAIAAKDRAELESSVAELRKQIDALRVELKNKRALIELLPDVEIYHKAVDWALGHDEFHRTNEVSMAKVLLRQGLERARELQDGRAPWTTATGLVVRGYISKIDGSVQPYGLVVPASYRVGFPHRHRVDVWLHGRDNNLSELKFISDRQRSAGEFAPDDTIVLHPYGRYCNAFKFAGETDVFEAIEHVRRSYPIDENRIAIRGFSMGGAGCWHLAVHHAGVWAAAAPGAGFVETANYTRALATSPKPPLFEQRLWHLYDATDYAANLFNCPIVAYSGELDKQKEAADTMAEYLKREGIDLAHVIGPKTEHRYHPQAKEEVAGRIDAIVRSGRTLIPKRIRFTTHTLRYNQMHWLSVDGLEEHWKEARVEAELFDERTVIIKSRNVSALTLAMPAGTCPLDCTGHPQVSIDGQKIEGARPLSDRSWKIHLQKRGSQWTPVENPEGGPLRKRHALQGPIDDAFMDSFIFVRPTGEGWNKRVGNWTREELSKAVEEWRSQFRGDARVKDAAEVTEGDIASSHLVLWGDPASNPLIGKIAEKLPVRWHREQIKLGQQSFDSAVHVPILIYPNPLNPKRYVVINSGFTFAKPKSSSNADQTPKLPDYAIVDIGGQRSIGASGAIAAAGFFDETWQLRSAQPQAPQ
jgi:hypothetical protein